MQSPVCIGHTKHRNRLFDLSSRHVVTFKAIQFPFKLVSLHSLSQIAMYDNLQGTRNEGAIGHSKRKKREREKEHPNKSVHCSNKKKKKKRYLGFVCYIKTLSHSSSCGVTVYKSNLHSDNITHRFVLNQLSTNRKEQEPTCNRNTNSPLWQRTTFEHMGAW